MATMGWRMVRYADDFVVLGASERDAGNALKDVSRLLRGRGLALNPKKTRIVPPGQELVFLGTKIAAPAASVLLPGNDQGGDKFYMMPGSPSNM